MAHVELAKSPGRREREDEDGNAALRARPNPVPAAAAPDGDDVLLRVENLVKYFPIKGTGLFRGEGIRARR